MRRFEFPIPTGWFAVAFSSDLEAGQVKPLRYFARDLVLFRDAQGTACVLDAHCPHLGAHLGEGGNITEHGLECPFHAWTFDGGGACTRIPYADKIPPRARLKAWTVLEKNGFILVWHDLAGREPYWDIPDVGEYSDAGWTDIRTREWTIRTCNQEMAENQVDAAHFKYLHGSRTMPTTTIVKRDGPHMLSRSTTGMTTKRGPADGEIEVNTWGFGFTTTRFTGLVETLLMASAAPVEEELTTIRFAFTVRDIGKGITGGIGKAFMLEVARQLEQDIPVWENKNFIDPPLLCEGDGPIGVFRQWARQFYPSAELLEASK